MCFECGCWWILLLLGGCLIVVASFFCIVRVWAFWGLRVLVFLVMIWLSVVWRICGFIGTLVCCGDGIIPVSADYLVWLVAIGYDEF